MDFFGILFDIKNGSKMPYSKNYFDTLFAAKLEELGVKTITGTLPLTFTTHTAGAVDNWTIYGNDVGVGQRTANLFNKNAKDTDNGYVNNTYLTSDGGMTGGATAWYISEYIPINSMLYYTLVNVTGNSTSLCWYDITKTYISGFKYNNQSTITAKAPANAAFCRVTIKQSAGANEDIFMLVEGNTAPANYIPYGYQIPLTVSQQGQTDKNVDIYIGDSPLTEGETVSKQSTGVDLELFEGENTVSTTLYNKPTMTITYK
jgi:hypothetical protein